MITVTGSLAFDYIMNFPGKFGDHIMPDKIHEINLSFLVDSLKKQRGGTAGNIAFNLALLKAPTQILGTVGNDFSSYKSFLKKSGVDTSFIKVIKDESTSTAFITTDLINNQMSAFYPGAMNHVNFLKIEEIAEKPQFVVISPTTPEAAVNFAKECKKLDVPYMLDPGMMLPRISDDQLRISIEGADILIGNDYEIALLKDRLKISDEQLLKQVKILIITKGAEGSIIKTPRETVEIRAAKPTEVVDPTGAGDAYRAGFLAGYLKGLNLKTCGQMGAITSCYAIEKYGTTAHRFTLKSFCQRYKKNFKEELDLT